MPIATVATPIAQNGTGGMMLEKPPPPVVVFKGNNGPNDHFGGGYGDSLDPPRQRGGDYLPYRDARTLTWDRNPKPDRSDPKYFPVNSLPRQQGGGRCGQAVLCRDS